MEVGGAYQEDHIMTQIEIILLALLYEEDRYGYEIESVIEERKMRNWTKIGFSSIYNSLKNLEKRDGLVRGMKMNTALRPVKCSLSKRIIGNLYAKQ